MREKHTGSSSRFTVNLVQEVEAKIGGDLMSWRPEGWKNPYGDEWFTSACHAVYRNGEIFEAGADAMLEALFELAKNSPTGAFTIDSSVIQLYRQARRSFKDGYREGEAHQYKCQQDDAEFNLRLQKEAAAKIKLEGIRKVVEYVESCTLVENIWEGDDWKAKKKEWGIG